MDHMNGRRSFYLSDLLEGKERVGYNAVGGRRETGGKDVVSQFFKIWG